jgi:hypothetical protein
MADDFLPPPPDDPMVLKLTALREEADAAGNGLLAHLIEIALMEAERLAEKRPGERDLTRHRA